LCDLSIRNGSEGRENDELCNLHSLQLPSQFAAHRFLSNG
jgi:hypothetical protein